MTPAMQQALLRRGCARLTQALADCRDLPAGEVMLARLSMLAVLGLASRGPMLALPWNDKPQPDQKMKAANDNTFSP
jgi:hypothetical protein